MSDGGAEAAERVIGFRQFAQRFKVDYVLGQFWMRLQSGFSHEGVDACAAPVREQKFQQVFAS